MEPRSGGGNNVGVSQMPGSYGGGALAGVDMGGNTYRNAPSDWSQFFGPSKGPIETAPYGAYRRENFALPDAYQGSNSFLTNVIITLVTEQDLWPVKVALPWRLTESEMEIAWDQIIFDNTLLGQVPEEGVSRLVTQQISERRDHYVRYGLAFMLEHGFMKTDRGRLCYRMNLEQIRNAILETAYLGVMDAYLRCKRPSFMGGIRAGMQRLTGRSLARALSQEVEQFAMVQKTEYGFDLLDVMGKKVLKQIGVTADLWILPEGMKMYLNLVRKENFQSPNAGAMGAIAPVGTRAPSKPEDVAVDVAYDCRVVETKSFELPNMSEPLNPMERPATIGEYYVMQNHLRGSLKPEEYRSSWRDVFLYNEDKDGFTRITLDAALRNCGRFDQDGDLVQINIPADGDGSDGSMPPDMFLRRKDPDDETDNWQTTDRMGDIHRHYLRDGGLGDWADSVMAKVLRADPTMARALRDGLDLCRRIDATDTIDGAQNTWALWLWMVHVFPRVSSQWNEEHGLPYPPTKEEVSNWNVNDPTGAQLGGAAVAGPNQTAVREAVGQVGPGIPKPYWVILCQGLSREIAPMMENGCGNIRAMPVGYANWPGMSVLANPRYKNTFGEIHNVAAKFVAAFDTLYSELSAHTHDSVFLDGAEKPPWLKSRDGRSTLFSNLLYVSHAPIWMRMKKVDMTAAMTTLRTRINAGQPLPQQAFDTALLAAYQSGQSMFLQLPEVHDINPGAPGSLSHDWWTTTFGDLGVIGGGTQANVRRAKVDFSTNQAWMALDAAAVANTAGPNQWNGATASTINTPSDYYATINAVLDDIKTNIFGITNPAQPSDKTFDRILNQFTVFFGQSSVVTAAYGTGNESGGVYLAHMLYRLATAIRGLRQQPDASSTAETVLYRIAAFINLAVHAKSMRALVMLMRAGWSVVQNEARLFTVNPPLFMTWTSDPNASLRKILDDEVRTLSGGISFNDIKEFDEFMDGAPTPLGLPIPSEAMDINGDEMILPTRLTGGTALRALTERTFNAQDLVWSNLLKVAVDPIAGPNGTPPHFEYGQHFGEHVPPLIRPFNNVNMPPALTARVGAKRRFGVRPGGFPARNTRGRFDFEEDALDNDAQADHALEVDPWGGGLPTHGLRPRLSHTLRERWRDVARAEPDTLRRVLKLAFLGQPVNAATFGRIIASDDIFPFGFLLLRPYMTYSMASAILTVGGARTGETLVGHADFQLADNVVQKMHIGNFTMYLKSIVYQPHHVWIADNVMACGYIGGNNCTFRAPGGATDPPSLPEHASMFACMIPYDCEQEGVQEEWEQELPNPLDITGNYASGNPALTGLRNSVKRQHYASSRFYANQFGWDNGDQNMSDDSLGTANRYNTLVFAGHFAMYNPGSQRYDLVHENTGHRGNRIYAGCGRVWKGLAKLLEPVNHLSAFGGAPVRSMVTNAV